MNRLRLTSVVFRLPEPLLEQLRALSERTRIRQSEYIREGISDLLAHYGSGAKNEMPQVPRPAAESEERATHVLVTEEVADQLRRLSLTTRVNQSDYLREAVGALLAKYASPAEGQQPAPAQAQPTGAERELAELRERLDQLQASVRGAANG